MNKIILQILLSFSVTAMANASDGIPCREAMDSALKKSSPSLSYKTINTVRIGNEGLLEVTAFVYGWTPGSDAASAYYYLVSATCRETRTGLMLWDDLAPGEGGVVVKTMTKVRY